MRHVSPVHGSWFRLASAGFVLAVAIAGGCRRPPPRTVPEMPALEVPPPPPRNVEPADAQFPPPVSLVDPPARTVERPQTTPPAPPRDATRPDSRPEPVAETAKPAEDPKPTTTLQTTTTNREGEVDRRIRTLLQTATADLNRIDYRRLNPDAQLQYDTAKSLIRQSEEALKTRNLAFAQTTAEKAATIASQLSGR
jgi:outer membrane biosynthesis protein TonB